MRKLAQVADCRHFFDLPFDEQHRRQHGDVLELAVLAGCQSQIDFSFACDRKDAIELRGDEIVAVHRREESAHDQCHTKSANER